MYTISFQALCVAFYFKNIQETYRGICKVETEHLRSTHIERKRRRKHKRAKKNQNRFRFSSDGSISDSESDVAFSRCGLAFKCLMLKDSTYAPSIYL